MTPGNYGVLLQKTVGGGMFGGVSQSSVVSNNVEVLKAAAYTPTVEASPPRYYLIALNVPLIAPGRRPTNWSDCYMEWLLYIVTAIWSDCYIEWLLYIVTAIWSACYMEWLLYRVTAIWSDCYMEWLLYGVTAIYSDCYIEWLLYGVTAIWSDCYI